MSCGVTMSAAILRSGEFDHVVAGAVPAGRDQARGAGLERERRRAQPVADDDGVAGPDARGKRRGLGGADEHVAGDGRGRVADDELAVERAHELLDGDRHALEALDLGLVEVARGKRALADEPERAPLAVDDRQPAHPVLAHHAAGDQHGLVRSDRDRIRRHDVAHARADVRDLLGQLDAEPLEDPCRLPRHRSETRRNVDVLGVGEVLQVRVGDRRDDRVVVGVLVAEDENRAHGSSRRCDPWSRGCGRPAYADHAPTT